MLLSDLNEEWLAVSAVDLQDSLNAPLVHVYHLEISSLNIYLTKVQSVC